MSGICELLERDLELYLEGELVDSRALRRVRRHLRGCAACRERAAYHDALTAGVLASEGRRISGGGDWAWAPDGLRREHRRRLEAEAARRREEIWLALRGLEPGRRRASGSLARRAAGGAALLLFGLGLALLFASLGGPGKRSSPGLDAGTATARIVEAPGVASSPAGAPDRSESAALTALDRLLWVAEPTRELAEALGELGSGRILLRGIAPLSSNSADASSSRGGERGRARPAAGHVAILVGDPVAAYPREGLWLLPVSGPGTQSGEAMPRRPPLGLLPRRLVRRSVAVARSGRSDRGPLGYYRIVAVRSVPSAHSLRVGPGGVAPAGLSWFAGRRRTFIPADIPAEDILIPGGLR